MPTSVRFLGRVWCNLTQCWVFPDDSGVPIPGQVVYEFGLDRESIPVVDFFEFLKWKEKKWMHGKSVK